ncbi:MAG: hypothetical protein U9R42_05750 [Bacteroidota bacterium]|nr:hypothetical protein [Bacteroidota bacterium]
MSAKLLILFSIIPIVISCNIYNTVQNDSNNKIEFEIKQIVSGSYSQYNFVFVDDKLVINEQNITKLGKSNYKKIYSKKIKKYEIKRIKEAIEPLCQLESKYIKPQLGGLRWELNIVFNDIDKKIIIENYYIPEISLLFDIINNLTPKNKPKLHPMK